MIPIKTKIKNTELNRLNASVLFSLKLWKQSKNCRNISVSSAGFFIDKWKLAAQKFFKPCRKVIIVKKSLPNNNAHRAAWSFPQPSAGDQFTLQDHIYEASALYGESAYVPAFAGTHCAYSWRDGQAELTSPAAYIPRWFTHLVLAPMQVLTGPSVD